MPFARRRPLLRAAAIGGVAYAGSKRGAKAGQEQAQQQQQQQQQPAAQAPPAEPAEDPTTTKLRSLADLHSKGVLTDEEFAAAKAKLLGL